MNSFAALGALLLSPGWLHCDHFDWQGLLFLVCLPLLSLPRSPRSIHGTLHGAVPCVRGVSHGVFLLCMQLCVGFALCCEVERLLISQGHERIQGCFQTNGNGTVNVACVAPTGIALMQTGLLQKTRLLKLLNDFLLEMDRGLSDEESSIKMIPSYVTQLATGTEAGAVSIFLLHQGVARARMLLW